VVSDIYIAKFHIFGLTGRKANEREVFERSPVFQR